MKHPYETPTIEGQVLACRVCGSLFLAAMREDDHLQWIPLRWWHRGFLRAKAARLTH